MYAKSYDPEPRDEFTETIDFSDLATLRDKLNELAEIVDLGEVMSDRVNRIFVDTRTLSDLSIVYDFNVQADPTFRVKCDYDGEEVTYFMTESKYHELVRVGCSNDYFWMYDADGKAIRCDQGWREC